MEEISNSVSNYQLIPNISLMPATYEKLSELFPDKPWLKIVEKIKQSEKRFPITVQQAKIDNWLAFALANWENQLFDISIPQEWGSLVKAMTLAGTVCKLCEDVRTGKDGPTELEARFRGALQNSEDARAIYFELYIAKYLESRGCQITWPAESNGEETFDLLVKPPKGLPEFELECKSFSGDKGARAGLADGMRLIEACINTANNTALGELFPKRPGMASILTVEVSDEIPKDLAKLENLAKDILLSLNSEPPLCNPIFKIVHSFNELIGGHEDPDACFNSAAKLPHPMLGIVVWGDQNMGWQALRVAWSGKITLWKKAEDIAKNSLRKQLTGTRPGGLALQFVNDEAEIIETSNSLENKYRKLANKLFTRHHAALVVVAGDINIRPAFIQPPYASNAFMGEFCKMAAFDNPKGTYPNSKLKMLFAPWL